MSNKMQVHYVSTKSCSIMAYQVTMGRIVMETTFMRGLLLHPRQFFVTAVAGLRGVGRDLALQSMIVWIHWGKLMERTIEVVQPDDTTGKRMLRSKRCPPAGVRIKDSEFTSRCENYACPMCWYTHVHRRLSAIRHIMETKYAGPLGTAVRVQGVCSGVMKELPTKQAMNEMYGLTAKIKKSLYSTGALSTVRIVGKPEEWRLAVDMVLLDADMPTLRRRLRAFKDIKWCLSTIKPIKGANRHRSLLLSMSACMEYPIGLFHERMDSFELQKMFVGERLVRSRATGILSSLLHPSKWKK